MKLKSLQSDNINQILYIEKYNNTFTKVYYQDNHIEIYHLSLNQFLKQLNHNQQAIRLYKEQYHSPIVIENTLFSPTKNIKNTDCEYFNLLKIEERNPYYEKLLEEKNILTKAKLRFLEYKKNELFAEEK